MTVSRPAMQAFNRGIISPRALARTDLKRTQLSAEQQKNWMPRTLGSMMLRPGLGYQGPTDNGRGYFFPFIRAASDTALLEFTNGKFRPWVVDTANRSASLVTRVSVSAAVTNGNFASNITSWTDSSESGAACSWDSGNGGQAQLLGTGQNRAILLQTVTLGGSDSGKRHALRITVNRGKITFRCGSTSGDDDYINETILGPGIHSLAFTPTTSFTVWFASDAEYKCFLGDCNVEAAGVLSITAPYIGADLPLLRFGQSVDVVYLACDGYAQKKLERRAVDSWSLVEYFPEDGPFRVENTTALTIAASAIKGDITLTASRSLFRTGHVGTLFRILSIGQLVSDTVAGDDQWSDPVQVSGIGQARNITVNISGTWVGTIRMQRSVGAVGDWEDVTTSGWSWTTNQTNTVLNDTFDNDLIFYRVGFKSGEYTSGSATVSLKVSNGGIQGIVRITDVASATSASALVLKTLGGTAASDTWWEGLWSTYRGFPSAVDEPYEGRLCWAGKDWDTQSVSGAYESFDDTIEGDSGPIIREIGFGPVDSLNWICGLQRLILGGDCRVYSARSSSLDEPLTPTNWNLKQGASQGSAAVQAIKLDSDAFYVQVSGTRLFRLTFNPSYYSLLDYSASDVSKIAPELGKAQFTRLGVQRMPDTRIHCVRGDGTAAVLVFDVLEEVEAWVEVETDGCIEDVIVLPGIEEDLVFYEVLRQPGTASETHCLELWAREDECKGPFSDDPDLNKQADCFVTFDVGSASPSLTVTGIPTFLANKKVVCWADGKDIGGPTRTMFTVSNTGTITLPTAVSRAVVGLYYEARYMSSKLAYGGVDGETALTRRKQVKDFGLIAGVMHNQGLMFGSAFDTLNALDSLPQKEEGAVTDFDTVWDAYDMDAIEFPGEMQTDSRICLLAQAPRPCELLGYVPGIQTQDAA